MSNIHQFFKNGLQTHLMLNIMKELINNTWGKYQPLSILPQTSYSSYSFSRTSQTSNTKNAPPYPTCDHFPSLFPSLALGLSVMKINWSPLVKSFIFFPYYPVFSPYTQSLDSKVYITKNPETVLENTDIFLEDLDRNVKMDREKELAHY